jgi:hypothetical protein
MQLPELHLSSLVLLKLGVALVFPASVLKHCPMVQMYFLHCATI